MDSATHVLLGRALLKTASAQEAALPFSLFPQIDRSPACFHRMYAHPFAQFADMRQAANGSYWSESEADDEDAEQTEAQRYFRRRLLEDRARIATHVAVVGGPTEAPSDALSCAIAFASHAYQDVFNNPIQAFLPFSSYPCATWDLWNEIDGIEFRRVLYLEGAVEELRIELFSAPEWNTLIPGEDLGEALVRRTAAYSAVALGEEVIEQACTSLGLSGGSLEGVRAACEFLEWHEVVLTGLIRKFSG